MKRDDTDREATESSTSDGSDAFFDSIPDPVCELDAANRFQRVNDALTEFLGYDRADLLGRRVTDIVPSQTRDRLDRILSDTATATSQQTETFELSFITDDGCLVLAEVSVRTHTDSGEYDGAVCVVRDISDRKRRERNLELLKQVFSRVFRHNIRNELMVTETHAEYLKDRIDPELQSHAEHILTAADRLLNHSEKVQLMEDVTETSTQCDVELGRAVQGVAQELKAHYPEATVRLDIPAAWTVTAHPRIAKAVEELLENALRHAPPDDGGTVDIWLDQGDESQTLFIEDESGGLAEAEVRILRKETEQKLEHGSGVGLWLVRWLVEYSGAELIVHRTDNGTVVGIRFHDRDDPSTEIDFAKSPMTHAPEQIRDSSPVLFHDDVVIGRKEALETLTSIYDGLEQTGGHTVLITGESGVGKTTLVEQFIDHLSKAPGTTPVVVGGVCKPGEQESYHAFREVLSSLPTEDRVTDLLSNPDSHPATSSDEFEQRRESLFSDIADQFRSVASNQPVVVVIEDLHYADRGTAELFEYLIDEVGRWGYPTLFVGTDSDVEENPRVLEITADTADAGRGTVIELEPLTQTEVRSLLTCLLGIDAVPDSFAQQFYDHTGGVPLFVTELVHHLAEEVGPIHCRADLPDTLRTVPIPGTVEQTVADRIISLPDHVRSILHTGAIIGIEFSFDVLREASTQPTDTVIEAVNTLVDRKIWSRDAEQIAFRHGVVREQTLAIIDQSERAQIHGRVADAIETVHAECLSAHAAELGDHYEQTGSDATAMAYYRQAAARARNSYANEEAIDWYKRALELAVGCDVSQETTIDLYTSIGDIYELIGEYDDARQYYHSALETARRTGLTEDEAAVLNKIGHTYFYQGLFDDAHEYYQNSLELSAYLGDEQGAIERRNNLAVIANRRGAYDRAREHYEETLQTVQQMDDARAEAVAHTNLGAIAYKQAAYDEARKHFAKAVEIYRSIDRKQEEAISLHNYGMVEIERGELDRAEELLTESLEIKQEIGDTHEKAKSLNGFGKLSLQRGEYSTATEQLERALDLFRTVDGRLGEAETLSLLGQCSFECDEYEQAKRHFDQALALFTEIDDHAQQLETIEWLHKTSRRQDDQDGVSRYYERANAVFADAPQPVQKQYEACLNGLSETLD